MVLRHSAMILFPFSSFHRCAAQSTNIWILISCFWGQVGRVFAPTPNLIKAKRGLFEGLLQLCSWGGGGMVVLWVSFIFRQTYFNPLKCSSHGSDRHNFTFHLQECCIMMHHIIMFESKILPTISQNLSLTNLFFSVLLVSLCRAVFTILPFYRSIPSTLNT